MATLRDSSRDTFTAVLTGLRFESAGITAEGRRTEARADTGNPARGPLLIFSGQNDNIAAGTMSRAAYKRQRHNPGVTEFAEIPGRGDSLILGHGWAEVAQTAMKFY